MIAPNWLGDAVMALPAIADLRRHYADAHLADRGAAAGGAAVHDGEGRRRSSIGLPARRLARCTAGRTLARWAVVRYRDAAAEFVCDRVDRRRTRGIAERWGFATDWRGRLLTRAIAEAARRCCTSREYYQALTTALGMPAGPPHATVWPDADRARQIAARHRPRSRRAVRGVRARRRLRPRQAVAARAVRRSWPT